MPPTRSGRTRAYVRSCGIETEHKGTPAAARVCTSILVVVVVVWVASIIHGRCCVRARRRHDMRRTPTSTCDPCACRCGAGIRTCQSSAAAAAQCPHARFGRSA